ncbi:MULTISPECIES: YadA-like family protein [Pasteurellaceae]|uniref:YadA-like family protein n=1 Tax=Pasteurella atlantica TaxID=2827233 RepID=A0AAW8CG40_9PAST|nr:YadA-like family protein [Pasteurella atlantica]MBR0573391.1 YadA-like family protein [Pasteurella atlantica]MDP8039801.1 YadA-like family protein [Pasteurella atlantica]MDP8041818.1 YadA-like family protein [Pasteurella atlantica]MDP8043885.1 YadA-like family protein [Pasteurella atlantica]MDP8046112.1 YadA-like family protein [Pasteurella atlantica]
MNQVYKIVFNQATKTHTVISELAKSRTKAQSQHSKSKKSLTLGLVTSLLISGNLAFAEELNSPYGKSIGINSLALGYQAISTGHESNAIGEYAVSEGNFSSALGYRAKSKGDSSQAIGASSVSEGVNSFAIGRNANSKGLSSYVIGEDAVSEGNFSTALGYQAKSKGESSQAIGSAAVSGGVSSFAIGTQANSKGISSYAIGESAVSEGANSFAIGRNATSRGEYSYVIGENAVSEGNFSTALGYQAKSKGKLSQAIGTASVSEGINSFAIGTQANSKGISSYAIGHKAVASNENSLAIGNDSYAKGVNAVALGTSATTTLDNAVALGYASEATIDKGKAGYDFLTDRSKFFRYNTGIWKATHAAVSVGKSDASVTRQINGLAAGTEDADAVNVAQIKALEVGKGKILDTTPDQHKTVTGKTVFEHLKANHYTKTEVTKKDASNLNDVDVTAWTNKLNTRANLTTPTGKLVTDEQVKKALDTKLETKDIKDITSSDQSISIGTNRNVATGKVDLKVNVDDSSITVKNGKVSVKDGGISTNKLVDNAVTTAKIKDANITKVKLATNVTDILNKVGAGKIEAGDMNTVTGDTVKKYVDRKVDNVDRKLDNAIAGVKKSIVRVADDVKEIKAGVAGAMATAGLPQAYLPGHSMVAAAGSTYKGATAIALGVSTISDNRKWIVKGTVNSNSSGDVGATLGAGYQW